MEQRIVQINNNYNNNNNNNNSNNNNNNNTPQQADSDNIYQELTDKNEELSEIYKNKAAGVLTRLKMTHIQGSEKSIKHLKSLEKQKAESKMISKLIINGKTINDQNEILDEQRQYYKKKLYEKRNYSESTYNFFQNHELPQLKEQEKQKCEGLLTEKECEEAVKDMKNGKTPGSDGLTVEFYKIFWQDLKDAILNSFNQLFQINSLSEIQKQGLITLRPKSSKDLTNLSNWRPISLLNVDYKIMTKTIASRIKTVLKVLIDSSQTGFIKGRYIGENIRLLFDIIEYTEENNKPGLLLFTDFEKSF